MTSIEANRYLKNLKSSKKIDFKLNRRFSFLESKILLTAIERGSSFRKEIPEIIQENVKKQRPIKEHVRDILIKMQSEVDKLAVQNPFYIVIAERNLEKNPNSWESLKAFLKPKLLEFLKKHTMISPKEFFEKLMYYGGKLDKIFENFEHIL